MNYRSLRNELEDALDNPNYTTQEVCRTVIDLFWEHITFIETNKELAARFSAAGGLLLKTFDEEKELKDQS